MKGEQEDFRIGTSGCFEGTRRNKTEESAPRAYFKSNARQLGKGHRSCACDWTRLGEVEKQIDEKYREEPDIDGHTIFEKCRERITCLAQHIREQKRTEKMTGKSVRSDKRIRVGRETRNTTTAKH